MVLGAAIGRRVKVVMMGQVEGAGQQPTSMFVSQHLLVSARTERTGCPSATSVARSSVVRMPWRAAQGMLGESWIAASTVTVIGWFIDGVLIGP